MLLSIEKLKGYDREGDEKDNWRIISIRFKLKDMIDLAITFL